MRRFRLTAFGLTVFLGCAPGALAQTPPATQPTPPATQPAPPATQPAAQPATPSATQPAAAGARTEVYHVHFTKAAPGQAAALAKVLATPDPKAAMPGHVLVLRHQEGDDWDYCVIQHLGTRATVEATGAPPAAGRDLRSWHTDTFTAGPPWAEFARGMGIEEGAAAKTASSVYVVGTHLPVPGHRDQLEQALTQPAPGAKVQPGQVLLQHLEGGSWVFLTLARYDSWQDLGADRAAASGGAGTGSGEDGWSQVRQHSASHRDTIADRVAPR